MKITWVLLFVRSIARQHPTEPAKAKAGDTTHAATAHRTAPAAADPEVLGRFLVELADASHKHQPRVDEYKGHRIAIETHYEITVDGTPVPVHLTVGNDGDVHCHALPAYEFVSAVDMVRVLIDTYPDDFPAVPGPAGGTRDRRGETGLGVEGG